MPAISQDDFLKDSSQFDVARKRVQQQSASNMQTRKDALARRFAALGNLDSGARLKLEQKAIDEESENLNAANEGIDAQQQAEMQRRREIIQGQQFQSGESEKGRSFSAEQAAMQRAFATSERLGGQEFARGERFGGQEFARGERLGGQEFQAGENKLSRAQQDEQFQLSLAEQQAGRKQQGYQFSKSFNEQRRAALVQERLATDQMKQQKDQFEKTYGLSIDQFKASKEQFDKTFAEEVRVNDANMRFAEQAANEKGFMDKLGSNFSFGGSTSSKAQSVLNIAAAGLGGPVGVSAAKNIGKKLKW
jgi:hypothetical protein